MRLCSVFCTLSPICLYTIKVCWIIINHTQLQGRLRIYFGEPGPVFRPALPLPSRLLIHLNLWYFTALSAVRSRKLLWMNRSNPDVLKSRALPTTTLQKAAVNGMFWQYVYALSKKNGFAPEAEAKMSSLAATPVITVPLRRQQTTADYAFGPTWKKLDREGIWVIIWLRYIYQVCPKCKEKYILITTTNTKCPTQKASTYTVLLNLQVNYSCVARQPCTSHVKMNLNLFHTNCSSIMLQFMQERERNGRKATFYRAVLVELCNTHSKVCRKLEVSECIDL